MRIALYVVALFVLFWLAACGTVPETVPERPDPEPEVAAEPLFDPVEEAYESISMAMALGDPRQAIAAFEEAQLEDPDSPETRVLLANLYLTAGEIDEARTLLQNTLDTDPDNESALFSMALVTGYLGDRRAEQELLERLLEINPEQARAQAALGELQLRNRRYGPAESAFTASLRQEPDNLVALVGMGNLKLRTENPEAAERYLDRAVEIAPEYSFAYADRSRARALQQKLGEAEQDLTRAIELDREFSWHYLDRGKVRLERNNFRGALEDFDRAIDRDPSVFMSYVYRARAYDQLGERDAAIADYRTALELRPDYRPGFVPLGVLLFESERYGEAAERFAAAYAERHPNDPADHGLALLAALSRKMAGDEAGARRYLEGRARDLAGSGLFADMARYYISPGSDAYIYRQVSRENDRFLRTRMNFFLAGQYEVLNRTGSARALYREVMDENLAGFIETRLARERHERLQGVP
ncbi:MAG: tetratricopeptide repeat protein [Spirochaetaceae bacterium]|nr:MAG: tetratricopeptide repeat protein [Spirochaetaceae bacterium]